MFRATGITVFRERGGRFEDAQKIAGHASLRTTAIYDHSDDEASLDEIERIVRKKSPTFGQPISVAETTDCERPASMPLGVWDGRRSGGGHFCHS